MSAVRVRRAGSEDLDVLAPLFDAYRVFYGQDSDPAAARRFLSVRQTAGESLLLLAELDGEAVGFVQLYPFFSSVRLARLLVLNDLFVADGARRQGVARALLGSAAELARDRGCAGLMLETAEDNHAAQALYDKLGWELQSGFRVYTLRV
ncbi:MAG: GNAT family N-acetyltransferase [Planctomycetes bacterium]|nr:GNAT family N-acetyltransferase [Planctomycetota bacterium]